MQVAVERQGLPQKVIDRGNRFDTGKSATCNNERQQWLALRLGAICIRFFQVSDQPIPQENRIAQASIVIARSAKPGRSWKLAIEPNARTS